MTMDLVRPMEFDPAQIALDALALYGLVAVFILLFLDGAMLLPGLPGEIVVIIYVTHYVSDPWTLVLLVFIGVAASMLSAIPLYLIGRGAAASAGRRKKRLLGMSPKTQLRMQRLFERPAGGTLIVFARLFLPTRAIVSVPAGMARMPYGRFMLLSLLGSTLFFVGFVWFAYEVRDPSSPVARTTAAIDASYAGPAGAYMTANWGLLILGLIIFGLVFSLRASRRMARDAHETSTSLLGTLVAAALLWGGALTLLGLWLDERLVYDGLALIGVDASSVGVGLPGEPVSIVAFLALLAFVVGLMLHRIRRTARRENRRLRLEERKLAYQGREPVEAAPTTAPSAPISEHAAKSPEPTGNGRETQE